MTIVSEQRQFIFIHVPKNAGTSIERALLPWTYFRGQKRLNAIFRKAGLHFFDQKHFENHVYASEVVQILGLQRFDRYFSFGFVRNPWERCLSLYSYGLDNLTAPEHSFAIQFKDFSEYLFQRYPRDIKHVCQKDWLFSSEGRQLVKYVGRYERLKEDFDEVCRRIGVQTSLPELNKSDHKDYRSYFSTKMVEFVADIFAPDLEAFGYAFE